MSKGTTAPRRERVEPNIYKRTNARGQTVYEVGYRDSAGKQRWRVLPVGDGIKAARAERNSILGAKGKGERVQPNPKLRFGGAAQRWLDEQVAGLRPTTARTYRIAVQVHLLPRWGKRRMDAITVDDAAQLVRELRAQGKSEWTISGVLKAASRVFKFASRRMAWHGVSPIAGLENGERPRPSAGPRRRIFADDELAQTIAAAGPTWRPLFALAGTTGARLGECLGLVWGDLHLDDGDGAWARIEWQVDRWGQRVPLKTEQSRREVAIPAAVAHLLLEHRARSRHKGPEVPVFSTASGRPLGQRNVTRELRRAMRAAKRDDGTPTFPVLHENDEQGRRVAVPRGTLPTFHGFRHTVASKAIHEGDHDAEVAWMLGHKNPNTTRGIYTHEIRDAEARRRRMAKTERRFGSLLEAAERNGAQQEARPEGANVVSLSEVRDAAR